MNKYVDQTNWIMTDVPIYAFRVQRPVPPSMATFSSKRLATGSLTDKDILAAMEASGLSPTLVAVTELLRAELALRSLRVGPAQAALSRALEAVRNGAHPVVIERLDREYGVLLYNFGGMSGSAVPGVLQQYDRMVAAGQAAPIQKRFVIPIPGCQCHSTDPVLTAQHTRRRMNECDKCHNTRPAHMEPGVL